MMTLCDTNIIIDFLKNRPAAINELERIGTKNLCVSVVTQAELIFGALNKADLAFILKGISGLSVLPVEPTIGAAAVSLMVQFSLSHRLALPDALIAATALHHDLPLYTLNLKDFRYIPGLRLHPPATA